MFCKKEYSQLINIIMADHGECDEMTRDIKSYSDVIDYYVVVSSGVRTLHTELVMYERKIEVMTCPVRSDLDKE